MSAESLTAIQSGALGEDAIVIDAIATAANTPIWAPVVLGAIDATRELPKIATTTSAADKLVYGVTVGKLVDSANGYCNTAAGDLVQVCVFGQCKVKVDGNAENIAIGDALVTHAAAGVAQKAACDAPAADTYTTAAMNTTLQYLGSIFAKALKASTADGDVIPCFVIGSRGTIT